MAAVSFDDVSKVFPDGTIAVDRLSLDVEDGEFLVLVGPPAPASRRRSAWSPGSRTRRAATSSSAARSSPARAPTPGRGHGLPELRPLPAHGRPPQPRLRALKLRRVPKPLIASGSADTVACSGSASCCTGARANCPGGQRQRVAMGRAIVREPQAFLMDEPLSNLDAKLRVEMRASIARLHQQLRTTTIYVTHDQTEAMTMGDRVAVMKDGRLEQVDAARSSTSGRRTCSSAPSSARRR